MPKMVIRAQKSLWEKAVLSLVRVPKNLTVQCRERGPLDLEKSHLIYVEFSTDVTPINREDLLAQLRVTWKDTEAGELADLYHWVKK